MNKEPIELLRALEKMAQLLHSWGLRNDDWIWTGQYVYRLLGYNTSVRPGHHNVMVRRSALPWRTPADALEVHPPVGSRFEREFHDFVDATGHEFDLVLVSESDMKWHLTESAFYDLPSHQRIRIHTPKGQLAKIENMLSLSNVKGIGEAKGRRLLKFVTELQSAFQDYGQTELAEAHADVARRYSHLMQTPQATNHSVRGMPASPGRVTGTAVVVTNLHHPRALKPGSILVTTMTSPAHTQLIKSAAAVVTDEGGLLSHAAIIARELHKPCIVATGNATQLLKTGDRIVVDADAGTVKPSA